MLLVFYDVIKDFEPGYNGNYNAATMDTMACIAVFNDDHLMFNRAVDSAAEAFAPMMCQLSPLLLAQ